MARYLYVNADQANGPARAVALGCGWMPAVPSEFAAVATAPCAIVSGQGQTVVVSDSPPTTAAAVASAAAPIVAAEQAAAAQAATLAANGQTIQANVLAAQTTIQNWITANSPNGAVLTAAQTLVLAKMLNGLCKLLLQQYASTTGT